MFTVNLMQGGVQIFDAVAHYHCCLQCVQSQVGSNIIEILRLLKVHADTFRLWHGFTLNEIRFMHTF